MPQLAKSTQSSLSEINMVPFIDVVLGLLIIFMITAPILQSGIEVDVPKTHTVKEITQQRLVVTMDKNQLIYLGNDPVNIHQLADKIHKQAKHQNEVIYLRAVAPGIAEALVTTAAGLFAAIPALIAYNYFLQDIRELAQRLDTFALEFAAQIEKTFT